MEHVYEKIVLAENTPSGTTATAQNGEKQSQTQLPPEELAALAEAKVELYCNDTVSFINHYFNLHNISCKNYGIQKIHLQFPTNIFLIIVLFQ